MEYNKAYTPEENGVGERFNCIIIQMIRSMLTWSKPSQNFWAETVGMDNYLQNLLPEGQDDLSPNKL